MKILLIAHLLPYPPSGGSSLRNFNLIKEAAKQHELHLLTFYQIAHFRNPSDYAVELKNAVEAMKKYCRHVEVFKVPTDGRVLAWNSLLFMNLFSATPYSAWKFRSREMSDAITRHAGKHSFDLAEIATIGLANYRDVLEGLPCVIVHQNIESELLIRRSKSMANPFSRAYIARQGHKLRLFEKRACEVFDYHTTVSERDRQLLLKIHPQVKAHVVPNGVDTEYFKPLDDTVQPNSLVFVGGMTWYPNLDAMKYFTEEIWHLIRAEVPDLSMNVIGRNPNRIIKEFAQCEPGFQPLGFQEDVRPHVTKAAVYVVPIRVGGGTRLKILDAMAMGKAVVSTSIGCEGIDVMDGVDIVIADTAKEFASKTVQLLSDSAMREEIGRNARKKAVERYSWKMIYPELEFVYREVAGMRSQQ